MPTIRHIVICEGDSEWAYLQRLQSFLDAQPMADGVFEPPLRFIVPERLVVKNGAFGKLRSRYNKTRKENRHVASIQIWTDFDLYHRNDLNCATRYAAKTASIPDFLFSFHNFEDFYALHWEGDSLEEWLRFGKEGHFARPLYADDYLPAIKRIFPGYAKGGLPAEFITWRSLKNLKSNLSHQPTSNPQNLAGVLSFAVFLVRQIESCHPGSLD